jgi:hypothetical protein
MKKKVKISRGGTDSKISDYGDVIKCLPVSELA